MTAGIQAEGLVKRFGETTALDGVDFLARPGTVLGLLGPNGAGKTTAVRILATLLQPDAGRATVGGYDVVRAGPPGAPADRPDRAVRLGRRDADRRREPAAHRPAARDAASGRRRRAPASCSPTSTSTMPATGRRRPTPAACAAGSTWPRAWWAGHRCSTSTSRPPAWTRAAAPSCGRSSAAWWRAGSTVLLTTQYLDEADQLADDIVVIDHGRVIATGTPDELKAKTGAQTLAVRPVDADGSVRS